MSRNCSYDYDGTVLSKEDVTVLWSNVVGAMQGRRGSTFPTSAAAYCGAHRSARGRELGS
jgi:hypothetical protein